MPEQRVSDAKLLNLAASCAVNDATVDGDLVLDLALDLRDARARLAALEPVVRAAVRFVEHAPDVLTLDITNAVDALPEALRKEFEA